jgi:hypothetical protein
VPLPGTAVEGMGTEGVGDPDGSGVRGVGGEVEVVPVGAVVAVAVGDAVREVLVCVVAGVEDWTAPVGVLGAPGEPAPVGRPGAGTPASPPAIGPEVAGVGTPPLPPVPPGVEAEPAPPGAFVDVGLVAGFWLFLRAGRGSRSPGLIGPPAKLKPRSRTYPRHTAAAVPSAQATHARRRPEASTKTGEWITSPMRSLTGGMSPHARP